MRTLSTIIVLFLCLNVLKAGDQFISGTVKSDLDIELFHVNIHVKGAEKLGETDCQGKFRIKAELGDTLILSKPNFESRSWIVDSLSDNSLILTFNYPQLRKKLEGNPAFSLLCQGSSSEPLYIIDGMTKDTPYYHAIRNEIIEENISSLFILKDPEVLDLLGPCAASGVVWINTTCAFRTKE
ncbi:MAG: hypothetical protein R8P61_17775 [Bacteroidia bacterium]|nr:hypothetical protein [Bacteroidia bacterium]